MAKQAKTTDAVNERVIAFSEQLGRMIGTVHGRAEGLLDRAALKKQIASIRDGAADLLEHMAGLEKSAETAVKKTVVKAMNTTGRSGGFVDAPGKKHRKPMPRDTRALPEKAKAMNMKAAAPMAKTTKLRGRG